MKTGILSAFRCEGSSCSVDLSHRLYIHNLLPISMIICLQLLGVIAISIYLNHRKIFLTFANISLVDLVNKQQLFEVFI